MVRLAAEMELPTASIALLLSTAAAVSVVCARLPVQGTRPAVHAGATCMPAVLQA